MKVQSIHLDNFRNYRRFDLEVGPSVNIFFGQNAQGKTNLIEAIYLCACARSHRTSKDRDLIYRNKNEMNDKKAYYQVFLDYITENGNSEKESVSIRYEENEGKKPKRIAYHNMVPFERFQDYIGLFNAVIFAPEDLQLVKEGPSVRRRYLDILISQVKPSYFYNIQRYTRLIIQRNSVIKSIKSQKSGLNITEEQNIAISIWDYPISEIAAKIIADRIYFSKKIKLYAEKNHNQISDNKENLEIKYKTVSGILDEEIRKDPYAFEKRIKENILMKLENTHREDCERGITATGPHRDDLELYLNGENTRIYASQGQQRSASLSLKLAEMMLLKEETKEMPVLLLDDVFSELDAVRRKCLLANIKDAQVFLTCTDRFYVNSFLLDGFNKDKEINYFEVDNGNISQFYA